MGEIIINLTKFFKKLSPFILIILITLLVFSSINFGILFLNRDRSQPGFSTELRIWTFIILTLIIFTFIYIHIENTISTKSINKDHKSSTNEIYISRKKAYISKFLIYVGLIFAELMAIIIPYAFVLLPYEKLHDFEVFLWIIAILGGIGVFMIAVGGYMLIYMNAWETKKTEKFDN